MSILLFYENVILAICTAYRRSVRLFLIRGFQYWTRTVATHTTVSWTVDSMTGRDKLCPIIFVLFKKIYSCAMSPLTILYVFRHEQVWTKKYICTVCSNYCFKQHHNRITEDVQLIEYKIVTLTNVKKVLHYLIVYFLTQYYITLYTNIIYGVI